MARHRSPQGRRAHLGTSLSAAPAAAGSGGALRSIPLPRSLSTSASSTSSTPVRLLATAVAGGALAAAAHQVLAETLPLVSEGATVVRLGAEELLEPTPGSAGRADGPASAAPSAPAPEALPPADLAPIALDPVVADAAELVKAADLQRVAAEAAAGAARAAEQAARAAERPRPAPAGRAAESTAGGGVQMVVGRVTSGFGARWGSRHEGLDIAAPVGTPIRVPLDGRVVDSGPASGFGMWVRVEHADGTVTTYGHVHRSLVRVGERVTAGEVIAEVGNRGQSTGPHLHLEVDAPGGEKLDPRRWLDRRGIGYS